MKYAICLYFGHLQNISMKNANFLQKSLTLISPRIIIKLQKKEMTNHYEKNIVDFNRVLYAYIM